jgi:hypothetical protein
LIIGAVVLGLVVSAAGAQTRLQIAYLGEINGHAIQMARNGDALRSVTDRLDSLSRDELVTVSEGVLEDLAEALAFVEEDPPVDSVIPIRSLFRQSLLSWQDGVEGYYTALLDASDRPDDNTVVDSIAAAIAQLRSGDAVYALLLEESRRDDFPEPLTPLPEVFMSPASGPLVAVSVRLISEARSPENTLTMRPSLAVSQLLADPEWQLDANSEVAVTSTEGIVFSVVLTNSGNVASSPQTLYLSLTTPEGPVTQELDVGSLAPGRQVTLTFESIGVVPGTTYDVVAWIDGEPDDWSLEDNSIAVVFTVNSG